MTTLDRRTLLRGLGAAGALTFASGHARAGVRALLGPLPADDERVPALVLLQLSGGNDGLSTVVPYADEDYARARGALAIPAADVRPLDARVGFHPALARLHEVFDAGNAAVVQGVGYPQPNRSHFKSLEVWHAADTRGKAAGEGWVGKLQAALFGAQANPNRCVHVGGRPPYALHSSAHPAASFTLPSGYRWVDNAAMDARAEEVAERRSSGNPTLDAIRAVAGDARVSSLAVRKAAAAYRPSVEYPASALGNALRAAAAMLGGGIGVRVVSVDMGGFDTHDDQRARHDALMEDLDGSLGAFLADVQGTDAGRDTVVLAFSEFGRRVAPNASGGTDHGAAGPAFLFGEAVRGGVHGAHPALDDLADGDLRHAVDFRELYATVVGPWFGADVEAVLGAAHAPLPLLPA